MTDKPVTPHGLLNMRNLEESHKFWTEVVPAAGQRAEAGAKIA